MTEKPTTMKPSTYASTSLESHRIGKQRRARAFASPGPTERPATARHSPEAAGRSRTSQR